MTVPRVSGEGAVHARDVRNGLRLGADMDSAAQAALEALPCRGSAPAYGCWLAILGHPLEGALRAVARQL